MRTPIIAGNWKMYKTPAESVAFAQELIPRLTAFSTVERVICPTFLALVGVGVALQNTALKLGAQNTHWEDQGCVHHADFPGDVGGLGRICDHRAFRGAAVSRGNRRNHQ